MVFQIDTFVELPLEKIEIVNNEFQELKDYTFNSVKELSKKILEILEEYDIDVVDTNLRKYKEHICFQNGIYTIAPKMSLLCDSVEFHEFYEQTLRISFNKQSKEIYIISCQIK